ncbi:hypothetical protein ASPFODRAFT_643572 [Aspergillus luchuensis CBS 106.47]|uniref:Uncharacterized protein n=1 Tax=Aspergillus luchuensis (strain CBS 106.47) TaxID=1137211 RepID=A0A1M3SYA6_ASPLC|nr:hypothetical protein ASPFODRAFT_643572 [Aspergillus luchuensis CBS 106.47]
MSSDDLRTILSVFSFAVELTAFVCVCSSDDLMYFSAVSRIVLYSWATVFSPSSLPLDSSSNFFVISCNWIARLYSLIPFVPSSWDKGLPGTLIASLRKSKRISLETGASVTCNIDSKA